MMKSTASISTSSTVSTATSFITMTSSSGIDIMLSDGSKHLYEGILSSNNMFSLVEDDVQIDYGKQLGLGGFCSVYPAHVRHGYTKRFNPKLRPYAIKKIRSDLLEYANPRLLDNVRQDLINEAQIMKMMLHANIVQLVGHSSLSSGDDLFVVMEKLETTLDAKMQKWSTVHHGLFKQVTPKETVLIRLREVAVPIANALDYMHSNHIMYRDLKPSNIGFDHTGRVKLFDFGFAVHNPENELMSEMAGTLRYMAPEMRRGELYDFSVDVYSYSILLWQIITSRLPMEKEIPEMEQISPELIPKDKRPNLKYVESKELSSLLENTWQTNPEERLGFTQILSCLNQIVHQMDDEESIVSTTSSKISWVGRRVKRKGRRFVSSMNNY